MNKLSMVYVLQNDLKVIFIKTCKEKKLELRFDIT